jgi:enamine deaminase RidA (YjgF/YER057c/UK114 family)
MSDLTRYGVTKRWSDAVVVGGLGYFVEVPDHPEGSPREQIEEIFRQVEARLQQIGSDLTRLVQVLVYLPFPEDLPLFNELWEEWIPLGHAPCRACTHPQLAAPGYRVELVITAAILAPFQ